MLSCFSRVRFFATPWTAASQAPLSMGFSRQEYWSGLPFPSPGDLPDPKIKPESLALAGGFFAILPTWEPLRSDQSLSRVRLCDPMNRSMPGLSDHHQLPEVKASASNAGDPGSIPGSGRSPGEGNGNPLQYSCLENPMVREAW